MRSPGGPFLLYTVERCPCCALWRVVVTPEGSDPVIAIEVANFPAVSDAIVDAFTRETAQYLSGAAQTSECRR